MTNDDEDIVELLKTKITEAEERLRRLKTALVACSNTATSSPKPDNPSSPSTNGVLPAIIDVCSYMRQRTGIVHQSELIAAVARLRRQRYPELSNHCSIVWRAIEYHVRQNRLIACVDEQGRPAQLKLLPPRTKGKVRQDDPAAYEQDNWFVLVENLTEHQISQPYSL